MRACYGDGAFPQSDGGDGDRAQRTLLTSPGFQLLSSAASVGP